MYQSAYVITVRGAVFQGAIRPESKQIHAGQLLKASAVRFIALPVASSFLSFLTSPTPSAFSYYCYPALHEYATARAKHAASSGIRMVLCNISGTSNMQRSNADDETQRGQRVDAMQVVSGGGVAAAVPARIAEEQAEKLRRLNRMQLVTPTASPGSAPVTPESDTEQLMNVSFSAVDFAGQKVNDKLREHAKRAVIYWHCGVPLGGILNHMPIKSELEVQQILPVWGLSIMPKEMKDELHKHCGGVRLVDVSELDKDTRYFTTVRVFPTVFEDWIENIKCTGVAVPYYDPKTNSLLLVEPQALPLTPQALHDSMEEQARRRALQCPTPAPIGDTQQPTDPFRNQQR